MKNYTFTINGNRYEVEVHEIEGNKATIEVNGTTYSVELHQEVPKAKVVQPAATPMVVKNASSAAPVKKGDGPLTGVKAPLPGVILQVLVRQGDEVKAGQTLCTLETMKMENAIKSDIAGIVSSVKIAPGQSVLQDELLIEIN
ncbi:MAG TPA: biotin/lipoyl-containing protein [Bacteroidales bacterium]|nr:biotin/lipoyl-containing protein [Bacteroidales bacterium]